MQVWRKSSCAKTGCGVKARWIFFFSIPDDICPTKVNERIDEAISILEAQEATQ